MPKQSAGILLFRRRADSSEVLLVHLGGPYWANKDQAAWSIPKGECREGEDPLQAAKREFREETGLAPVGTAIRLEPVRQSGGKLIHAWAMEGDFDPADMRSNTFRIEWPPHSGQIQDFPEADRAAWFSIESARTKILKGQVPLLQELQAMPRSS